ncbi:hypothetical protein AX15_003198 [Amanita polypyramis BW_CC]|nr:hypothetical protein AX15_003198 [Amanita polypyramis BW_CC]
MSYLRTWISLYDLRTKFSINVSWCPAHMDVLENEFVDKLATSNLSIDSIAAASTLKSKITEIAAKIYNEWDSQTRKHHALGHDFLRLKFNNKRIGPSFGQRKKIFYEASNDNIKRLAKLTRIITNHAPIGVYRRRWHPNSNPMCKFDPDELHDRRHILCNCSKYKNNFSSISSLMKHKDRLLRLSNFLLALLLQFGY